MTSAADDIKAIRAAMRERVESTTDILKQAQDMTNALWEAIDNLAARIDEQSRGDGQASRASD